MTETMTETGLSATDVTALRKAGGVSVGAGPLTLTEGIA